MKAMEDYGDLWKVDANSGLLIPNSDRMELGISNPQSAISNQQLGINVSGR